MSGWSLIFSYSFLYLSTGFSLDEKFIQIKPMYKQGVYASLNCPML